LGAAYRLFTKDDPQEPDHVVLLQFAGLLIALSVLFLLCGRLHAGSF
jgi:hypothetical protein